MSHPEQLGYFRLLAEANAALLPGARLLEIGSYDVNGSVRSLFRDAGEYVGVDLREGPGVDRIAFGHEIDDPDASYDVALSGECFEHDPHWQETFATMVRVVRPGGLVAFTCASRGRPEHGTVRTDATLSPGTQHVGLDHYRNLVEADFAPLPLHKWFSRWSFFHLTTHGDLYFAGVRKGGEAPEAQLPDPVQVEALTQLMPFVHRVARLPLRAMARSRASEETFQNVVVPYWNLLQKLAPGSQR